MKFCTNCGKQLNDEVRFCEECGAPCAGVEEGSLPPMAAAYDPDGISGNGGYEGYDSGLPPSTAPVSGHSRWPWILAGSVALLVLMMTVIYHVGNFSAPAAVRLAPVDSELFISIKPNMFQYRNFEELKEVYLAIPEVKQALEELQEDMKTEEDISFETDIKPWLGKEAAVIVHESNSGHAILSLACTDTEQAERFISKITRDENTHQEVYQGINITCNEYSFAAALVDDFLVYSNDRACIERTIDLSKGLEKETLKDNPDYEAIVDSLPWNRSGFCYVNMGETIKTADRDSGGEISDVFGDLDMYKSMGLSVSVESKGVRGDYVLACEPGRMPEYLTKHAANQEEFESILSMLPADSLGFAYSTTLINLCQYSIKQQGPDLSYAIDGIERETGINVEKDVLNVLRGDAALALMPRNGDFMGEADVPFSAVLAFGVSDKEAASRTTDSVLDVMESEGLYVDAVDTRGENKVYNLCDYYGKGRLSLSLCGDLFILGSSPEVLTAIMSQEKQGLLKAECYKDAFACFPGDWERKAYVNVAEMSRLLAEAVPDPEMDEIQPWLQPMKSLSMANAEIDPDDGIMQGGCFICIKQ